MKWNKSKTFEYTKTPYGALFIYEDSPNKYSLQFANDNVIGVYDSVEEAKLATFAYFKKSLDEILAFLDE